MERMPKGGRGKPEDGSGRAGTRLGSRDTAREVLRYVSRGLCKKEIAAVMNRSIKTVDHHTSSLMKKLDIHDRVALTRCAIREGLTEQ